MLIDVDVSRLEVRSKQKPMRINISIPAGLVHDIDAYAKSHGATRSGFLAQAARAAMAHSFVGRVGAVTRLWRLGLSGYALRANPTYEIKTFIES